MWLRAGTTDCQGMEVPWDLANTQNYTQRKIIQASEDTRRHQEMGQHRGERCGRTQTGGQDIWILVTRNSSGPTGALGGRGGEQTGKLEIEGWNHRRDNPLGPTETLATLRAATGGGMEEGRGGRNGPVAQELRGREGHWVVGPGRQGREVLGMAVKYRGRRRGLGEQYT